MSWSQATLEAFRLAERLFGDAPEGRVAPSVRAALDARGDDTRALAMQVAARVRLTPAPERIAAAPARVRALLGAPGAAPRRRYAPPPGLASSLRRWMASVSRRPDGTERGRARRALAALTDEPLLARVLEHLGAEEAEAVRTLRALDDTRDPGPEVHVRAMLVLGVSLEVLGALLAGVEGEAGDGPARAGRELRAIADEEGA